MTKERLIGILIASGIIYMSRELLIRFKNRSNVSSETKKEMAEKSVDYEQAKENLLTKKIASIMKIDNDNFELANKNKITQGDRLSFNSDKYGFVTGEFIGVKNSLAKGYKEILIIKINEGKILQAPLEYIKIDSITIYGR